MRFFFIMEGIEKDSIFPEVLRDFSLVVYYTELLLRLKLRIEGSF